MAAEEYKGMAQKEKPGHVWYIAVVGWPGPTREVSADEEFDVYATSKAEAKRWVKEKLSEDYEPGGEIMEIILA